MTLYGMVLMHVTHYKHGTSAHDTTHAWHGSYHAIHVTLYMASVVAYIPMLCMSHYGMVPMHVILQHVTASDCGWCGMGPMHVTL